MMSYFMGTWLRRIVLGAGIGGLGSVAYAEPLRLTSEEAPHEPTLLGDGVMVTKSPVVKRAEPTLGLDAALGRGVTIMRWDRSFSLNLRARFQGRSTLLSPIAGRNTGWSNSEGIRRMRIVAQGRVLDDWAYYVQLGFAGLDLEPDVASPLRDAHLTWTHVRDLHVRVGQMKVPFDRQRLVSSAYLQLTDRSLSTLEFNLDRDVGLTVFSENLFGWNELLSYQVGVFGGDGRNRLGNASGALWVGRLEIKPLGPFDSLSEGDLKRSATPRLAVAAATAHNQNSNRSRSTFSDTFQFGRIDYTHVTADLHFKWYGFSLLTSAFTRSVNTHQLVRQNEAKPGIERSRPGTGYYLQCGQMLTDEVEVVGRVGEGKPSRGLPGFQGFQEYGGGVNYYLQGHDLKLQGDYFYAAGNEYSTGRHQVRLQVQLFL